MIDFDKQAALSATKEIGWIVLAIAAAVCLILLLVFQPVVFVITVTIAGLCGAWICNYQLALRRNKRNSELNWHEMELGIRRKTKE